jgi:hypothetical protein
MSTNSCFHDYTRRSPFFFAVLIALGLAGCSGARLDDLTERVDARYIGSPVSRALADFGPADRERRINGLQSYAWATRPAPGGGDCTLLLVTDSRGIVIDYRLDGSLRGCGRLVDGT